MWRIGNTLGVMLLLRKVPDVSSTHSGLLLPFLIHKPPVSPRVIEKFDHVVVDIKSQNHSESCDINLAISDPGGIEPVSSHGWNP